MIRILLICTANICRSPFAAESMKHELRESAHKQIEITSAGTNAAVGEAACDIAASRLRDVRDHWSRQMTRSMVEASDLILTMERRHRGLVATLSPKSSGRVFTLAEMARLANAQGMSGSRPVSDNAQSFDARFYRWVSGLDGSRSASSARTWSTQGLRLRRAVPPDFDIPDGHFENRRRHWRTLDMVVDASRTVASQLSRL